MGVTVIPQPTPNPNSVKFTLDRPVIEGESKSYFSPDEADTPLAESLFSVDGVASLFFLNNFITVGKEQEADWNVLVPRIQHLIESHFSGDGA